MRHLHGRIQGGLLCKHGGIDDVYPVIGDEPTSHERKRSLTAHQSYLDIDAVDQEFILQKKIHVETAHQVDHSTPYDVRSSSHEPFVDYLDGIHVSGRILVPQLKPSVACPWHRDRSSQRLDISTIRVRVGRRGHERAVQVDVD